MNNDINKKKSPNSISMQDKNTIVGYVSHDGNIPK